MSKPVVKVGALQAAPVDLDLNATIDKAITFIEQAAKDGASLLAFPETWFPGYPWWIWVQPPIGSLAYTQKYFENSLEIDSPEMQRLCDAARKNEMYLMLGLSERSGGSLYMGQALIDSDGRIVFSRRKLKPTHIERTVFGEGDGSDFQVHDTDLGRIGALCCWEHIQPLSKYAMYAMNEQIHVGAWPAFTVYEGMAHALGAEVNNAASQIYAVEGQCYVVAPCALITEELVEQIAPSPEQKALIKPGGGYARIFGPDGQSLGVPIPHDQEGIVYADIDIGTISIAKAAADPAGHYSRPDVTRLLLDRRRKTQVVEVGETDLITNEKVDMPGSDEEILL